MGPPHLTGLNSACLTLIIIKIPASLLIYFVWIGKCLWGKSGPNFHIHHFILDCLIFHDHEQSGQQNLRKCYQPTSFTGARKCSISSPIPRSTFDKGLCLSESPPPIQHCMKLSHCYNNLYQMIGVRSLYQKTHKKPVNREIFAPPLCLTVSPTTFFFLQFLGIFCGKTPTS